MKIEIKAPDKKCIGKLLRNEGFLVILMGMTIVDLVIGLIVMVEKSVLNGIGIILIPSLVLCVLAYYACKLERWSKTED